MTATQSSSWVGWPIIGASGLKRLLPKKWTTLGANFLDSEICFFVTGVKL
jgi:hypothetical protein